MIASEARRAWGALLPDVTIDTASPRATSLALDDHASALERAGIDGFVEHAAAADTPITLVVNDTHRLTDTHTFLTLLFGRVRARPRLRFRVLVATGSHRSTHAERVAHEARVLGTWRTRITEVRWHDARDDSALARVGTHEFHEWMAEGGWYLGCGSMEPHYFAGVTGAHKTLTVGVMSMASLTANHAHAMSDDATVLRLAGNPVHEGIVRAVADLERSGGHLLALNQLVVDGTVLGCTAGRPLDALALGVDAVRACFAHVVPAPVDLVVARVAPPLDRSLYQADKGIKNTEAAVRNAGVLVLEAPCLRGIGLDRFVELLRTAPSYATAVSAVRSRGYRLGDHKAVRLRALTDARRVNIALVTDGVAPDLETVLGMRIFRDRRRAAAWATTLLPHPSRGIVVEDAGNVVLTTAAPRR